MAVAVVCASLYYVLNKDNNNVSYEAPSQQVVRQENTTGNTAESEAETTPAVVETPKPTPPVVEQAPEWPVQLTSSEASSMTVVVNKKHKLPSDYVPDLTDVGGGKLRPEAAQALTSLLFKANEAGVPMSVISSYRSYQTQVSTYNKWVNQSGQADADTFSARPGHSEHQTGLAVDLGESGSSACDLETCFGDTAAGIWLANNASSYGFIIRYPLGRDATTGYQYEPWHLRYVGVDAATAIAASGQTMDVYYGVTAGDY